MSARHPPDNPEDVNIPIEGVESNHTNANCRHTEDYIRDIYVRNPLPPNHDLMDYCNSNKYPAINSDALYRSYTNARTSYPTYPQDSSNYCPCGSNDVGVTGYKWCKTCRNEKNMCQCHAIKGTWDWDLRYVDGCDQCRGKYKVSKELWGPPIYPGGRYGLDWEYFMKDQHVDLTRHKGNEKVVESKALDLQVEPSAASEKRMGKGKAREAESGADDDTWSDSARTCKTPLSTDEERPCFEDCERMEAESRTYEELFRASIEDTQVADIPAAIIGAFKQRMAQHEYIKSSITAHNEIGKDLAWRHIIEGAYSTQNNIAVRKTTEAHTARGAYEIQIKSLGTTDREDLKKAEANRVCVGGIGSFEEQAASREAIDQVVVEDRVQSEVKSFLGNLGEEFRQDELKQKQRNAEQGDVHQDVTEHGPEAGARTAKKADFSAKEEIRGNGEEGLGPESFQYQHDHSCC